MKKTLFFFLVLLSSCMKQENDINEEKNIINQRKDYSEQTTIHETELLGLDKKTMIDDSGLGKLQVKLVLDFDEVIAQAMAKEMQSELDINKTTERNGENYEDSKTLIFVNENNFLKTENQKRYEKLNKQSRERGKLESYKIITITGLGNRFVVLTPQRIQDLKEDSTQRTIKYGSKDTKITYYNGNETNEGHKTGILKTFTLNQPTTGYLYKLVINVLIGEDITDYFFSNSTSEVTKKEIKYDVEYGSVLIKKHSYEEKNLIEE